MHTLYESTCIIGYCNCWIVGEWFICVGVLQVCVNFDEVVFCVHYENSSTLSHSLMALDRQLFLGLFNSVISFNIRLL